jgi:AhpD family alkylhydroperoxidase
VRPVGTVTCYAPRMLWAPAAIVTESAPDAVTRMMAITLVSLVNIVSHGAVWSTAAILGPPMRTIAPSDVMRPRQHECECRHIHRAVATTQCNRSSSNEQPQTTHEIAADGSTIRKRSPFETGTHPQRSSRSSGHHPRHAVGARADGSRWRSAKCSAYRSISWGTISRAEKEVLATAVSGQNAYFFCADSHSAVAALMQREGIVDPTTIRRSRERGRRRPVVENDGASQDRLDGRG